MTKISKIFLNSIPVLVMIGLIPLVANDYLLAGLYIAVMLAAFIVQRERHDITVLVFGFVIMILSELLFVSTGVETFIRNSLWGIMPVWLPFLWGYGFVAIKRSVKILEN